MAAPVPRLTRRAIAMPRRHGVAASRPGAFDHELGVGRIAPFALVAMAGIIVASVDPVPSRWSVLAIGVLLTVVTVVAAMYGPWGRLPRFAQTGPPLLYIVAVALLRHAGGGIGSDLVPLFALPVIWVALYGSRAELFVTVAALVAATIGPIVVIGPPDYPRSDLHLQVLNGAIGMLVGLTVNGLVEQVTDLASIDALTGVSNRRTFDVAMGQEVLRVSRTHEPVSVILLDVDHFKAFNDTYGHPAGDRLLSTLARAWADEVRGIDLLARYCGEEFIVLLPASDQAAARSVADRLRARAREIGGPASAGVATWRAGDTSAALIGRADAALYQAKALGRDRTEGEPSPA